MIAHVDIRFFAVDLFTSIITVVDERQLAEDPAPDVQKEVTNPAETKKEGEGQPGKE